MNIFILTSFITLVEAQFRPKTRTPPAHGSSETLPSSCTLALRWAGLISQLSSCVKAGLSSSEMRAFVDRDVLIYWGCVVRPRRLLLAAAVRQEATVQRRFEMFEMSSQRQQAVVGGCPPRGDPFQHHMLDPPLTASADNCCPAPTFDLKFHMRGHI